MADPETPVNKLASPATNTSPPLTSLPRLVTLKLSYDNYLLWRAQLTPYLRGQHLFHFMDGSSLAPAVFLPSSTTPNPEYAIWL